MILFDIDGKDIQFCYDTFLLFFGEFIMNGLIYLLRTLLILNLISNLLFFYNCCYFSFYRFYIILRLVYYYLSRFVFILDWFI